VVFGALAFRSLSIRPAGGQGNAEIGQAPSAFGSDLAAADPECRRMPAIGGLDGWLERCGGGQPGGVGNGLPATGGNSSDPLCGHLPSVGGLDSWVEQCGAGQR
jgi:hypothetical protein